MSPSGMDDSAHAGQWKALACRRDPEAFMDAFGRLHDACIREPHLWTGHYVNPDLSMRVDGGLDCRTTAHA